MKKRALKRLGAGLLAAVMVLGMGMTAFADEPSTYKLTINPNNYVAVPEDSDDPLAQRFEAFQIFSGTVIQGSTGTTDNYGTIDDGELGNVAWGANVTNKDGLVKALAGSIVTLSSIGIDSDKLAAAGSIYTGKTTLGDLFTARLTDAGYSLDSMNSEDNKVAMTIGQVLSDFTANGNNSALAEAFAKIAASYVGNGTKSSWNDTAWEITLTGGYYIVKDNGGEGVGGENNDKVFSDFLVGVFGATTVNVKANAPDVEKVIVNPGTNANDKGSDFEQGKIITFKLTGTLPSNYGNFDTYKYVFHDTYSEGISYIEDSAKVVAKTNGSERDITPTQIKTTGLSDGCKIEVIFDNLKQFNTVTAESEIIVTYNAYLNDAASLVKDVNTNKVHIEYSNNPNGSGTTETRNEKVVYVDTFGMKIHKYDASIAYDNYLEGAGFVLKSGSEYAIYRGVDGTPVSTYDLVGWLSSEKVTALVAGDWENANDAINGFIQGADHDGLTTSDSEDDLDAGTYYIVLESKADKDMQVEGLNEGTYTLEEVYAPDGFDPIDPITVKYEATYYDSNTDGHAKGTMKTLKATVGNQQYSIIEDGEYVNQHTNNVAAFTVANYPVMKAPGTGGAGTYLIYGIGAVLVIVAGAAFIITGRKKREA